MRDVAGDAAQKAANKVNPSEDQLAGIDKPADDNTWHDVPDMSRDNLRNQAKGTFNKNKPFGKGDLQDAVGDATQSAHPMGSRDPADAADLAARDQQEGTNSGVDAQQGLRAGVDTLKGRAQDNVPEDSKDQTRQTRDAANAKKQQTKQYFQSKMPQDRRDQTIWRLKKMIVEIQGHQDCKFNVHRE